jgi:hypothetical protein
MYVHWFLDGVLGVQSCLNLSIDVKLGIIDM